MAAQNDNKRDQKASKPGTERHRDEQRDDAGPQYAGGDWEQADSRNRLEPEQPRVEDEPFPDVEGGGERAGMERGRLPRKDRGREPG
jgi:hypothetical protein